MPDAPRPYRAMGYPLVPAIFLLKTALLINTFAAAARETVQRMVMLIAGLPLYWYWSRRNVNPA
jgi:APA family basic amino acid/polyamine antiporter